MILRLVFLHGQSIGPEHQKAEWLVALMVMDIGLFV
jgi:hypothetical protein